MADTLTAVAGAAIGFVVGGPQGAMWGWSIGSTVGSLAFAQDTNVSGPRLDDLSLIDSSYGQPIPIIYGRDRVAGNIIWAKDLEEVETEEEEGKGGPKTVTTTYQYYATFALGLCEGEILGVRRIWINSKLVYKFTDDATVEEILASNAQLEGITIYTGSESQEADPLIQADKGAANTPAFRGLAYMVFDRLEVTETGGIPNITVEVISSGSHVQSGYIGSKTLDYDYAGGFQFFPGSIQKYRDGVFTVWSKQGGSSYATEEGLLRYQNEKLESFDINGNKIKTVDLSNTTKDNVSSVELNYLASNGYALRPVGDTTDRPSIAARIDGDFIYAYPGEQLGSSSKSVIVGWGSPNSANTDSNSFARGDLDSILISEGFSGKYIHSVIGGFEIGDEFVYVFMGSTSTAIDSYALIEPSANTLSATETGSISVTVANLDAFALTYSGGGTGTLFAESRDIIWAGYAAGGFIKTKRLEKSGTAFSVIDVTESELALSGLGVPYHYAVDGVCFQVQGVNLHTYSRNPLVSASGVTLSSIVSDICQNSGLAASDFDVTDLTDTVHGYTISRVMSARKAIEPLMLAYHFDGGEFNNKLNFVKRGGAVAVTIPENDLGADSDALYNHTRQQEAELPSEVILDYKDLDRDYQPGSQRSRRINTNVENISKVDVPIALTRNEAKRLAEIHHYNALVERERFEIQVTQEYISLNPADVIQFTAEGDTRKARIVDMNYGPVMKLECVAESGAYTSSAAAGESETVDQAVGLIGPTNLQLLDIPMLRNSHNDTGIYLAASGYYNAYAGCRVFKSVDDVSYSEVDALFNKATQGYTTNVLADASHTTWDRASSFTVRWTAGTAPGSITESNAVKGVRYFLVGDEIVIPVNETDNGNGSYTYDTLVRGRRGTDWATSTHATGDRVIILTESVLSRLEVVLSTARYFKGVSIGNYLANAESETFTNTGVSLKPFSPTFIRGTRDGSNNLTITWIPRSRYIGGGLQPLPLFEDSESYKVEILDSPGGSVIATLSPNPTTTTDTYSAADQTSDGLTPGDPVTVRISQYSATVGYGYTKEATI